MVEDYNETMHEWIEVGNTGTNSCFLSYIDTDVCLSLPVFLPLSSERIKKQGLAVAMDISSIVILVSRYHSQIKIYQVFFLARAGKEQDKHGTDCFTNK